MHTTASHQTVRLSPGRHASPARGVCVMELASMLAGEPFSDQPRSACPALGAVLRAYNDLVDDGRRQDLYAYAARVVDTRGDRTLAAWRASQALAFFDQAPPRRRARLVLRLARLFPAIRLSMLARASARYAKDSDDESHAAALAMIDRLIAYGGPPGDPFDALLPPPPRVRESERG